MILVAGSTGFLGGEICRRLRVEGRPVRALVREASDPARVLALEALGAIPVTGDLKDRDSLRAACAGVDVVVSTVSTTGSRGEGDSIAAVDRDGQLALVDTAVAAGVRRYVYVSFSGRLDVPAPLTEAKRAVEARVRASGMTWTILRPSAFMEAWLSPTLGFDWANGKARVLEPDEPVSWISMSDVAAFAAACLDAPEAADRTLELGGPEALRVSDAARIFGELTGRPLRLERVPAEALRAAYESAADPLVKSFAALMLGLGRGDSIPMEETVRRIPVRLTSVREYAEASVANSPAAPRASAT